MNVLTEEEQTSLKKQQQQEARAELVERYLQISIGFTLRGGGKTARKISISCSGSPVDTEGRHPRRVPNSQWVFLHKKINDALEDPTIRRLIDLGIADIEESVIRICREWIGLDENPNVQEDNDS